MNIIPKGEEFTCIDPQMPLDEARQEADALESKYNDHFKGTDLEDEWVEMDVARVNDSDYGRLHELWVLLGANRKAAPPSIHANQ